MLSGTSSNFGFADSAPLPTNYYTVRSGTSPSGGPGIITIQEGQQYKPTLNLISHGFNNGLNCSNAPVTANVWTSNGTTMLTWASFFQAGDQTTNIDIKTATDKNPPNNYALNALATAPIGSYLLRFTVAPPNSGSCAGLGTRTLDVPLSIEAPPGGTSIPTKFVVFQGYAVFRISYMDANTIKGYSIGPLYQHLSDIIFGMTPRLIPWN